MRLRLALMLALAASAAPAQEANFDVLRREVAPLARARGVADSTLTLAFRGLTPDPRVLALTKRQPEYGKPVGDYIAAIVSPSRIAAGKSRAAQWADTLARAEQVYGVDRFIVAALWGIESSFGDEKDRWDVIRSLATLAQARYRAPYFRDELVVALKILQDRPVARDGLMGSWAGAMGQPQFMPSSFYSYAVDFSGDGRRDLWTSVPDVLGSIANYMHKSGWRPGLPWGVEVRVPPGFDYEASRGTARDWTARGFTRSDGGALPDLGNAYLLFPSGAKGPAFLVSDNFNAIKAYNNSDVYALAVGHLADRLGGSAPIRAAWPASDPQLSRPQRIALQRKLAALGYPVRDFEGHFDFDQRDAIRAEQRKRGMTADGNPTAALLETLRVAP